MPAQRPVPVPLDRPVRLAVLISGGGTTLVNLVKEIRAGRLNAEIPLVVAGKRGIAGIGRARELGLRCDELVRKDFPSVVDQSAEIFRRCRELNVDLVVLAGYLSLLTVPDDYALRVMNIHPSLIPAFCGSGFYGHFVHEAAIARGVKWSGCTVHFVDNEYDHGPIILQATVPVLDDDTPDELARRVFDQECEVYPEAIRLFAAGSLEVDGAKVCVRPL